MFNCILLSQDEEYIAFLDDDSLDITYTDEIGEIPSISVTYPLSEHIDLDRENFKIGNKLFLYGDGIVTKLYVIVESTAFDFVDKNNIEFRAEDVITELNFVPFFIQHPNTYKYTIDSANLNNWFGNYFDIGRVDTVGATDDYKKVPLVGTMSKMDLLRKIEENTGNYFKTEYKLNTNNKIQRILHFRKQENLGRNHNNINELIDLTYNADNIEYIIDESDTYTAISPVLSIDLDSNNNSSDITQSELAIVIDDFLNIDINKGDIVPMICNENNGGTYPLKNEGVHNDYWRRVPGDSLFKWCPRNLIYAGTVTTGTTTYALKSWVQSHPNHFSNCTTAGTFHYWNGSAEATTSCAVGDIWISNGNNCTVVRKENATNVPKYVTCEGKYWYAPFSKIEGDFYVQNYEDENVQYDKVYMKSNVDNGGFKVGTYPKIGQVETSDVDAYSILNDVHNKMLDKQYPKIEIELSVKDLNESITYDLFDRVYVKIPSFKKLINAQIIQVEKNPHLPTENKITISTESGIGGGRTISKDLSYIALNNAGTIESSTTGFNLKGKLFTVNDQEQEIPLANKLINIIVTKPSFTWTETVSSKGWSEVVTTKTKTTYYDKYGRNPDKTLVCGIGKKSSSKDTGDTKTWWKGIFKNYCPNCKKSGKLTWSYGSSASKQKFTCSNCKAIYSVQGHMRKSPWKTLSKSSLVKGSKINATSAALLVKGKYVYKKGNTKTAKKTIKGTSKKVTHKEEGETKTYIVKTDNNGNFSKDLSLLPIHDYPYTISYNFSGDAEYNGCDASNKVHIKVNAISTGSTSSGGKTTSKSISPISRPSTNAYSGKVNSTVINKGKAIVGSATGASALKLVANWVAKNIAYESKQPSTGTGGFYQSPAQTLKRKKGNDECQCELILHLLEGAGIAQDYIFREQPINFIRVNGHTYLKYKTVNHNITYMDPTMSNYKFGYYNILYPDPSPSTLDCPYPQLPINRKYK